MVVDLPGIVLHSWSACDPRSYVPEGQRCVTFESEKDVVNLQVQRAEACIDVAESELIELLMETIQYISIVLMTYLCKILLRLSCYR